jgi:hypothetical protein
MWAAFRLLPLVWQLGTAAAGLAVLGGTILYVRASLINEGEQRRQNTIDKQNQGAKDEADRADARVGECYDTGGVWDDIAGKCQRP